MLLIGMATWEQLGDLANLAQLTGLNAGQLIVLIVKAAATAKMHKRNCRQFAQHLKLIGNLLEQLKISELKRYPETREPLEQLEDALRRSYLLVESCQNRSYLYLFAMGWSMVYQFRRAQSEIDRYLRIIPLITLVDNARVRERIDYIERDECEYTLDDEDEKVQDALLNLDIYKNGTHVLKKSLSCTYPNLPFVEALKKENDKLKLELQRSQTNMDIRQCEVIEHLLGVTEAVANSLPEEEKKEKKSKKPETSVSDDNIGKGFSQDEHYNGNDNKKSTTQRCASPTSSGHDLISDKGSRGREVWHSDLLDCCSKPYLCIGTFLYPCGTFSKIASVAKNREITSAEVCNDIMAYSLILSCCCYTCCIRRKLRITFNIKGGFCDDFLSHLLCCCCALVQEWREVEARGIYGAGPSKTKMSPPPSQQMES